MVRVVVASACACLLAFFDQSAGLQPLASTEFVAIEGLKAEYTSCAPVSFSVKNTSREDVYTEIYAEKFESGSWSYEDYPYDLKDPKSRYVKRVLVNPETLKPGSSLSLTYDRCLRPSFLKESDKQYRRTIIERDYKSSTSALQRFRVQIYIFQHDHLKFVKNVFSEPFRRTAAGNSSNRAPGQ